VAANGSETNVSRFSVEVAELLQLSEQLSTLHRIKNVCMPGADSGSFGVRACLAESVNVAAGVRPMRHFKPCWFCSMVPVRSWWASAAPRAWRQTIHIGLDWCDPGVAIAALGRFHHWSSRLCQLKIDFNLVDLLEPMLIS